MHGQDRHSQSQSSAKQHMTASRLLVCFCAISGARSTGPENPSFLSVSWLSFRFSLALSLPDLSPRSSTVEHLRNPGWRLSHAMRGDCSDAHASQQQNSISGSVTRQGFRRFIPNTQLFRHCTGKWERVHGYAKLDSPAGS